MKEVDMNELLFFAIGALAVWRITHLLHAEMGPANVIDRLRAVAARQPFGSAFDCFYCLSLWVALPVALALRSDGLERLLLWPALSGIAILIERLGRGSAPAVTAAQYVETPFDATEGDEASAPEGMHPAARITH